MVLSIGLGCRHTGSCRHCAVPTGPVCDAERQATHHANRSGRLPGDLLFQQGPIEVYIYGARQTLGVELTHSAVPSAGLIIAGWDERHGGQVYSIPAGGSLHKQAFAIGGSGSTYIYGYCDSHWREGMEEQEAVDFMKGALQEAIKWDGSSGGVIRLVVLTKQGAARHLYLPDEGYKVRHE